MVGPAEAPGVLPLRPLPGTVRSKPERDRVPGTSHGWLCVGLHTGYNPNLPFISCGARSDRQFECELWAAVGTSRGRRIVPIDHACEIFAEFVGLLNGAGRSAEPVAPRDTGRDAR